MVARDGSGCLFLFFYFLFFSFFHFFFPKEGLILGYQTELGRCSWGERSKSVSNYDQQCLTIGDLPSRRGACRGVNEGFLHLMTSVPYPGDRQAQAEAF